MITKESLFTGYKNGATFFQFRFIIIIGHFNRTIFRMVKKKSDEYNLFNTFRVYNP
jgi:hypothetical protein